MKKATITLYSIMLLLAVIGCSKDDSIEIEKPGALDSKVTSVNLMAVEDITGTCPAKFDFEAEITTDGPMTLKYTWLRSDGATAPEETLVFDAAGSKTMTRSWTFGADGNSYEGNWQQLKIVSPNEMLSNKAEFDLHCEGESSVELVSLDPSSPSILNVGDNVEFEFNYATDEPDGVRIFGRPFTGGSATPDYAAHGSPIHDTGEGSGSGFFTINSAAEVDQIQFQMWDAEQDNLLYEFFVDVEYEFVAHTIEVGTVTPESPDTLCVGEKVEFQFDYTTGEESGVRIFGRPITGGDTTAGYSAHPSPIHPTGDGTASGFFTINTPGTVDQIRFQMWDADQNNLLYETFVDVDYEFIAHDLEMTTISPVSPATLVSGEKVEFSFDYKTIEATGVRIFGRPFSGGVLSPNYAAHGSPIHLTGEGTGTGYFTINGGAEVDQIRFQMWDADQNNLLHELFVDVDYEFMPHNIELVTLDPGFPGSLTVGENVEFSIDYKTNEPGGVRIFGRPFTNGSPSPNYAAHGSPVHPTGDGTVSGFFTVNTAGEVDQIRFQMWDADQNNLLHEFFVNVDYEFNN